MQPALAGKSIHPPVYALGYRLSLGALEEIAHQETHLFLGHDPGTDRAPKMLQGEAGEPLCLDTVL